MDYRSLTLTSSDEFLELYSNKDHSLFSLHIEGEEKETLKQESLSLFNETGDEKRGLLYAYLALDGENEDEYPQAAEILETLSQTNDSDAIYLLSECTREGKGVGRDSTESFYLCKKAALLGNAMAEARLGVSYLRGYGVEKDVNEAIRCFEIAAEQEQPVALYSLGVIFSDPGYKGYTPGLAFKYFARAAGQGSKEAYCRLGRAYKYGEGVRQDYTESYEWFLKAAESGNANALDNLGLYNERGLGREKNIELAVSYYRQAADLKYPSAQRHLGLCYLEGKGVAKDPGKAFYYIKKAADQNYPIAHYELGILYRDGIGTQRDEGMAFSCFLLASNSNIAPAQYELAKLYLYGENVTHDHVKAIRLLKTAASHGNEDASDLLSDLGVEN